MAWLIGSAPNASEGKMIRSPNGNAMFPNGAFYVLKSANTTYSTSSTETSLFLGDSSATVPTTVQLGPSPYPSYPGSTRVLPPGSLTPGTMFNFDFFGSLQTNGTPNLTLRLGLVGPYPSTTFNAIADTTATALTSEATACFLHISGGFNVQADSPTAGILNGWIAYEYAPTLIAVASPVLNTTSFNTRGQYTLDIRATFSASDAANVVIMTYGAIEVVG
jgi:hypothetical protein